MYGKMGAVFDSPQGGMLSKLTFRPLVAEIFRGSNEFKFSHSVESCKAVVVIRLDQTLLKADALPPNGTTFSYH